jgi:hypothetical protein
MNQSLVQGAHDGQALGVLRLGGRDVGSHRPAWQLRRAKTSSRFGRSVKKGEFLSVILDLLPWGMFG